MAAIETRSKERVSYIVNRTKCFAELIENSQTRSAKVHEHNRVGQIFCMTKSKLKEAARSACLPTNLPTNLRNPGMDSYADPGGGEPPPTPTSPACDSAYSEHSCDAHPSQPSSGRSSPRWDEDDEEDHAPHHVLNEGSGTAPNP